VLTDTIFKCENPLGPVNVSIDFDGITRRIRKISSQNPQADLRVTPEGLVVFISDGDVWSVSYDGKETRRITSDGGKSSLRISADGQKAYYRRYGELWTMRMPGSGGERVTFAADCE